MLTRRRYRSYRRRGYSRATFGLPRAIVVVGLLGALALTLSATGLGSYIAQRFIVPFYQSIAGETASSPMPTDSIAFVTPPAPAVTGVTEIYVPEQPIYAVQLGVFSSKESALSEAIALSGRGAAGYVLEDAGKFRVLAAAYRTAEDARSVRDNLVNRQGMDAALYTGGAEAVTLRITAIAGRDVQLKQAFEARLNAIWELMSLSEGLDTGAITNADVSARAQNMRGELSSHMEAMRQIAAAEGQNGVSSMLYQQLQLCDAFLSTLNANVSAEPVAMAQKIKYNILDLLDSYTKAFAEFM